MFWTEYNDSLKKKKKKKHFFFFFFFFSVSLYSVQNIAIHRIRFIFDSSNTLVYRLGPNCNTCIYMQLHSIVRINNWIELNW